MKNILLKISIERYFVGSKRPKFIEKCITKRITKSIFYRFRTVQRRFNKPAQEMYNYTLKKALFLAFQGVSVKIFYLNDRLRASKIKRNVYECKTFRFCSAGCVIGCSSVLVKSVRGARGCKKSRVSFFRFYIVL